MKKDYYSEPYGFLISTDGCDYLNILKAENSLNNLIYDKKIPSIIGIFIDTIETRREDLYCNNLFCKSIVNEVIPYFKNIYNLSDSPKKAIINGLSLGGLSAMYMGINHSDTFSNILCKSGAFWYKPEELEKEIKENENLFNDEDCWISKKLKTTKKLELKIYMNIGVMENQKNMIDNSVNVKETLESLGYNIYFEFFKSGHDYLSWGEALAKGLIFLIGYKN